MFQKEKTSITETHFSGVSSKMLYVTEKWSEM